MTPPSDPHRDLAGVLHDVSNALTVLLGWVGEAAAPNASPEAIAYALSIIEGRARIARDLARHAIGSPRIDEQRDIGAIVDEVSQALAVEAQHCAAHLVVRRGEETAKVAGALDVSEVLTNLVLNALAHAPPDSSVEVNVSVDEAHCTLTVSDEGRGIASEQQEEIFNGTSLRPGGSGIGLRHSRALARAGGGDVTLVTHEGRGARFRVIWPRIVEPVPRPPTSAPGVSGLVGMRVLVVEDDVAVTQLLETALEARGAEITVAATATELTMALAAGSFDAFLVDLSPIAADPASALGAIGETFPKATVILITGSADALPLTAAPAGSKIELVRKPFEVREVIAALVRGAAASARGA